MSRPLSLRARLLIGFAAGLVLSAIFAAIAVLTFVRPFAESSLRESIEKYTDGIARYVRFDTAGRPVGLDETKIEPWIFRSLGSEILLRVSDPRGQVAFAFDSNAKLLSPARATFDPEAGGFAVTVDGVAMHASTSEIVHENRRWPVQFAASDRLILLMQQSFGLPGLTNGIVLTCASFFLFFILAIHFTLRSTLRPLRAASAAALQITPQTLAARLDSEAQPIEIRPLVEAFNQALARLERGFRTQQDFMASAAHELKTPLALIRAQVERDATTDRSRLLLSDVDRMAHQVQQLLLLAEVSEPNNFRIVATDPRPVIQDVFEYMARIAEQRAVHLGLTVDSDVRSWLADKAALFTLLKNVLENAIQHTPQGGVVTLLVHANGWSVLDEGPGVPAEDLHRMFDRFWRGADRRDEGAGLGLAICREIALAHRWNIEAVNYDRGLAVSVSMVSG